jgi:hypothetical protein
VPDRYLFDAASHPASIGRATDLALYLALVHTGPQAGSLRPYVSRRRLSEAAGLGEDTVSASLHRLEAAGLIRHLDQVNDHGTHRYEIRPPTVPDISSTVDTTLWIGDARSTALVLSPRSTWTPATTPSTPAAWATAVWPSS